MQYRTVERKGLALQRDTNASLSPDIDPVTFSVILSRFDAIVSEMARTLERTAVTPILALCRDFSCAVCHVDGREVYLGSDLPIQLASMHLVVEAINAEFDGEIEEGDVYICNDPWLGNTHIGDLVTAAPVFIEGEHRFWTVTRAHQLDTGASIPTSISPAFEDVFQEGVIIPPTKLTERGRQRDDVLRLYLSNMRYRDSLEGDLLAQLASIQVGRRLLEQLCDTYGASTCDRYVDEMLAYSERRTAEAIGGMPNGTYVGDSWMDGSGWGEEHVHIRAEVTIEDDRVKVDFTGSAPQVQGGANGTLATAIAAGTCPVLYCLGPDIPRNAGGLSRIEVVAPEGTVCNASYPASTSCATVLPSDAMQEAVTRALTRAVPELVMAGTARCANVPQITGIDERTGERWGVQVFNNAGGGGAALDNDGWPMLECLAAFGGIQSAPIEELELNFPLHFDEWEAQPSSMGHGRWVGGCGSRLAVRPTAGQMEVIAFGDGCFNPPHGAIGGTPGIGGGQCVEDLGSGRRTFLSPYGNSIVKPGQRWVGVSTGGGGYGDPAEREPELVREAVVDGMLTVDEAREIYLVALSGEAEPSIDAELTEELRAASGRDLAPVDPIEADSATWLGSEMRPGDEYVASMGTERVIVGSEG